MPKKAWWWIYGSKEPGYQYGKVMFWKFNCGYCGHIMGTSFVPLHLEKEHGVTANGDMG